MATDADQNSEVVEQPTTEVSQDAASSPEAPAPEAPQGETPQQETVVPTFTPDFKLKVYDEEKELQDPFLRGLIKDEESQKKVKEIAQKYLGFDTVKTRHEKTKEEYKTYQEQTKPIVDVYNQFNKYYQKGDLDGVFELLGIPADQIFRYAVQKAEEAKLPYEQQQQLVQQRQIQREREMLAHQNQHLLSQQQEQAVSFRNQELMWSLARPEVSATAQSYDTKMGKPGAFRELVITIGAGRSMALNQDYPVEQAIKEAMQIAGYTAQPAVAGQQVAPQANLIQQNGAPPIIPNVTGKGTSPVRKQVRSLDDIKKRREELSSR